MRTRQQTDNFITLNIDKTCTYTSVQGMHVPDMPYPHEYCLWLVFYIN